MDGTGKGRIMSICEDNAWWNDEGIFCVGGWHPLSGRIRRNANCLENEEELFDWEYSEERIARVKEIGANLVLSQFDRGLGDADQEEAQEKARKLAELCHAQGIRHGSYMANTVYFESMLKEHPECEDWVVRTYDNRFVHYGGEQTFRWVACFNSPGWRERMRAQITKAVSHVKTDLLHFDNLAVWPEPDSCHCAYCQTGFRKFLLERYPSAELQRKRFGFTGFDTFRAPNFYLRFSNPWDFDRFSNPLMQDWIDFRCWTVTDYIREMSGLAKSLNPEIAIDSNGQSVWGSNQALLHGINQTQQLQHVDIVCEENPDWRADEEPDASPKVAHKFRGMNLARKLSKSVLTSFRDEESLAFNLCFSGNPGINMNWGYAEPKKAELNSAQLGVSELLRHFKEHKDLYCQSAPMARTYIWRSQRSLAYISFDTHLSACIIEHVLFKRRIPFSIIQDEQLNTEALAPCDLLILPDVEYISDEQVTVLTAFVSNGGSLLITEKSGIYDGNGRKRTASAFSSIFNGGNLKSGEENETGNFDPNKQIELKSGYAESKTVLFGKGRCAYLSGIAYKYLPRHFKSCQNVHYDSIDSRYWKDPYNVDEILNLVEWLNPDFQAVKIIGHPEVRLDWLKFADGGEGCQIIRCDNLEGPANLRLMVLCPEAPEGGKLYTPEQSALALSWRKRGAWFETVLPSVTRHAVVKYGAT
jgi:hypothetical protein